MTIYKPKVGDKKDEKEFLNPEVVVEQVKKAAPTVVTVSPRRRRNNLANICVLLTALAVFATGILGGIYLYRHLVHGTFRGWCGVRYYEYSSPDYQHANQGAENSHYHKYQGEFEEYVEIDKDTGIYEKIDVPEFQECKRATVLHDFEKNLTAIIDKDREHCFVLPLNRTMVKPPRDFFDLLSKLKSGYYLPNTEIVREKFHVLTPAVENLTPFGFHIWQECKHFNTYRLVREGQPYALAKREACHQSKYYLGTTGTLQSLEVQLSNCE